MTTENRQLVTLDEIKAIELCCSNGNCVARVTLPFTAGIRIPENCPQCGTDWFGPLQNGKGAKERLKEFAEAASEVERLKSAIRCSVNIQIPSLKRLE